MPFVIFILIFFVADIFNVFNDESIKIENDKPS